MNKLWKIIKERIATKGIDAKAIYSIAKYGEVLTEEGIKARLIKIITNAVQSRISSSIFSTVVDLDTDNPKLLDYVKTYIVSRGFICYIIDNSIIKEIDSPKLYIGWKLKEIQ